MGLLRREVLSPCPSWRKPHALATLFLAALMFASSLDAMLLAYKLRNEAAWAERADAAWRQARRQAEVERLIAEQNAFLEALRLAEAQAWATVGLNAGQIDPYACSVDDPLCLPFR
jgi:hypothetical protein